MRTLNLLAILALTMTSASANAVDIKIKGLEVKIGKSAEVKVGDQASAKHTCHVEAFGKKFFGSGESKGEAKRAAVEKCQDKYHGMHCDAPDCDDA